MTIISSQHYIDPEIVERKMSELAGVQSVTIPCYYVGIIDGVEYAMQADGHHTLCAARELGINVIYNVVADPEDLTGENLLDARYGDGDWYNVEESNPYNEQYTLTWQ